MLAIRNLSFTLGGHHLFDGASALIPSGHKVGLVGRNGTGKTTLLRLIRRELALDGGDIEVPRNFSIGGVAQEAPASDSSLMETVLAADTERAALLAEAESASEAHRIAEIQIRLTDIDSHSAEARAAAVLAGLGFDRAAQARPCREFSGGWRMRVALAAVLFSEPDLLLLDEPTNYLDLEGTLWLERFLARYPRTALVVSHDRDLLNRSVTGILHLSGRKLRYYSGTYDQFDAVRRLRLEQRLSMKRRQDAQRAHIQSFVDRFRYKATKARQAQSRLKMLQRMEPISGLSENAVAPFHFAAPKALAPPLLTIEGGSVGYDGVPVLGNLNLRLDADDRIALLGANGEGKSTLSKLLAGRLPLMGGRLIKSAKLRIGYFAQHQLDELMPGKSALQHLAERRRDQTPAKLRARLAAVGIPSEIADNPVERLSGGQKARLLMALAALDEPHVLILDEPINHFDIESREALVHALNEFPGAVIVVSHDPHLVATVADRLWLVQDGAVAPFDGDMADYRRLLLSQREGRRGGERRDGKERKPGRKSGRKGGRKDSAPRRAALRACERRMDELTAERAKAEASLADPVLYETADGAKIERLTRKLAEIDRTMVHQEEIWMRAQQDLDDALETQSRRP